MRRVQGVVCLLAVTALFVAVGPSSTPVDGQASTPPILVVLNNTAGSPLGNFYAEILRTEGVHAFATANLASITATAALSPYRLVVLAETALSPAQAAIFDAYVTGGGRLIAMRPDADLNGTLGITSQSGPSTNRPPNFLSASIVPSGPGAGLTTLSLPFRGPATHYALAGGATVVATMSGGAAGGFPAVHRFGRTATWSFDLAKSVAYVRQGDPLDKNLDRDGQPVYRTNDIFYQRLDLQRVNVPHADVHMRLFVRMIETLLADSLPVPRLWYYPGTTRTLMVVTGDSHTSLLPPHNGLLTAAENFGARVSVYLSRYSNISASTVAGWISRGHEVGLHPYFDPDGLNSNMNGGYTLARNWWQSLYSFNYSPTARHHSLEWTGWADPALTMQAFGVRLDLSYYAWGPALNNPTQSNQAHGYINGSGQAMPFIQESGAVTPVYQLVTSLTDEQVITGTYAEHMTVPQALAVSRQLIDESQAGFYAAIATQFHVDYYLYGEVGPWVDGTMDYARSLQIPMWTSEDYLAFIERRRDTTVTNVNWSAIDRTLTFDVTLPPQGGSPSSSFTMLVPSTFNGDTVTAVAVDGQAVSAPQFTVNGRSVRTITVTRPSNGAARRVAVLYAVPTPALAIGDLSVTEGHSGNKVANVPVTLSTPSTNTITVNYSGTAGTASGTDFQVTPGTLTFAPFETSKTIPATIVGDLALESNETFSITLAGATNATIDDGVGIVTINDDDAPPAIAITDATVTEGNTGTVAATFTVSLAYASGSPVTVQYATASGTATAGADFTAGSGTLTFAPGVTVQTVSVAVIGETAAEPNETFAVNLSVPVNGVIGDGQGLGTIVNDDSGTVTNTVAFPVLSGADDVTEEGTGFTADAATVWVGAGATPATSFAGLRFANVTIPPGAVITSARLELRSANAQWLTTQFEFAIEASANSAPFSAASRPSQRTLLAPRVMHTSNVQWLANTWYQLDEIATLLQPAINQAGWASGNALALVARGAGQNWARKYATAFEGGAAFAPRLVVTYSSAQPGTPSLSIADATVAEGNSGTANATFQVNLSAPTAQVVTVAWATANGTAAAGTDYTAASGTVTFPANSTTPQTVSVPVSGDTTVEPTETFVVNLSAPTNATIGDGQATGTITNDDAAPSSLAIGAASIAEGNGAGTQLSFPVTLTPASGQQVTVNYATSDGTATAGSDYTTTSGQLVFAVGETAKAILVPVTGDTTPEANETLTMTLSVPVNATIGTPSAQGTITNDDTPTLTLGNATVVEGTGGTTTAAFTVTLSPASTLPVQVNFATANGTATAGVDYTAASGQVSFAAAETSKQIQVTIASDALDEPDETFTVALSGATNATIAAGGGAGTITDDDGTPSLSVTGGAVNEGNAGTTPLTFTVTLTPASGQAVSVAYATAPGTATSPADFTAASGTLNFAAGETSKTVNVSVLGETLSEANETFTIGLSNAANATIGTASATGTITNDDPLPSLTVNDVTVNEGQAGSTPLVFTVTLSPVSGQTVTVTYAATAGSAAEGSDFAPAGGTLTFNPGVTTQQVTVNAVGDTAAEPTETFTLALSNAANATIGDPSGLGTLTNDDGIPTISIADATVAEGAGTASFTVTLSEAGGQEVTVNYATANTTALAGTDYTAASGTLTFPVGTVSLPVVVTIAPDTLSEAGETFAVNLSAPVNATIADGGAVGTITDDDPLPVVSIADAAVAEGNAGTATLAFQVTLNTAAGRTVTVNYATSNGTATAPGDFAAATGTVTFAAGETAKAVNVAVVGETAVELNESLTVTLSSPVAATLGDDTAIGTITNDDSPSLSIAGAAVAEGNAGTTPAVLNVTLSAPVSQIVTVNFAVTPGTATAATDYTPGSGTLTFQPGETAKTVSVAVLGETLFEANETFTVTLSGASGATIGTAAATGTITNDDAAPTLSINDVTVTEGTGATVPAIFTVTLSAASGVQATVTYTVAGGSATAGTDFTATSPGTLTFAPGVTAQQVTVTVTGDAVSEGSEGFTVNLSSPANATIADGSGAGTITDNDAQPAMSIAGATVTEGNAGTVNAAFTVSLSAASGQAVSASVATANGTATAGSDYTALPGGTLVTFAPGVVTQTVNVPVAGDTAIELSETFTVTLSAPVNATLGTASATGTITNDDLPALSISDVAVNEGNVGTANATFTISLSQPSPAAVSVSYATANVTATAGSDYTAVPLTVLTFPAGTTSLPVAVSVIADTVSEPNETFAVNLSAPAGATIADAQGVGTITNDDAGPVTVTVTYQVAAGADDVNESASVLTAGEATNWLGAAAAAATSYTGLRFTNVTIPAGATITSARLEGHASSTQWLTLGFEYAAEAAVNSAAFTATARPSQRTLLTPRVTHSSNVQWVANTWYQLEQIAPLLQAVVTQPGWTAGNALSLVIRGTGSAWGRKYIRAFEGGAATAPRLVITYQVSP